jgi:hypothetical protein
MTERYFTQDVVAGAINASATGALANLGLDAARTVTVESRAWTDGFDTDQFREYEVVVARPIEQTYVIDGEEYTFKKPADELRDAAWTFDNAPHPLGHPETGVVRSPSDIHGFHESPKFIENYDSDGDALVTHLYIPDGDEQAMEFIEDSSAVSVGFHNKLDWDTDEDGVDAYQRSIVGDHIASVKRGRCSVEDGCGIQNTTMSPVGAADAVAAPESEDGEHEMSPTFSEGDWVEWDWRGGTAIGRVSTVSTDEPLSVGETTRDPEEQGEPVYKMEHWDEEAEEFGNMKVAYESNLSSVRPPETDAACSDGPCSCGVHTASDSSLDESDMDLEDVDLDVPDSAKNAAQAYLDAKDDGLVPDSCGTGTGTESARMIADNDVTADRVENDIAPYLTSHEEDVSTDTHPSNWSMDEEAETPWKDCGDAQYAAWGWTSLLAWAQRKADAIKRAKGEETVYDTDLTTDETTVMDTITYDGTMGGDLDESAIPNEGYEPHYVFDADTKSESSYPLVDADGNLRRGNVESAYNLRGHADDEGLLMDVLMAANDEFEDPPIDFEDDEDAKHANEEDSHTMSDDDNPDGDTPDVGSLTVDAIAEQNEQVAELQADKAELADQKAVLDDKVEDLEGEVETLQDELEQYRAQERNALVEEITDLTSAWDEDDLDGQSIEELENKLQVARDAISGTPTAPSGDGDEPETNTDTDPEQSTEDGMNVSMDARSWG